MLLRLMPLPYWVALFLLLGMVPAITQTIDDGGGGTGGGGGGGGCTNALQFNAACNSQYEGLGVVL